MALAFNKLIRECQCKKQLFKRTSKPYSNLGNYHRQLFTRVITCTAVTERKTKKSSKSTVIEKIDDVDYLNQPTLNIIEEKLLVEEKQDNKQESVVGWGLLVGLCWVATTIVSIDRTAMSIAIIPMSQQLGWDESTKGLVNSVFLLAYMVSNLLGGPLGRKYSQTRVLCGGLILWSLATALTPMAATQSFNALLLSRLGLGLGEGVAFPSILGLFRERVPLTQRTRMTSLIYSGINFGTVISLTTAPILINSFSWQGVFVTYGTLGLLWTPFWLSSVSNAVSNSKKSELLLQNGNAGREPCEISVETSWKDLLGSSAVWAIIVSQCSWACGFYTTMAWLPTFFNQEFHIDIRNSALLSLFPVILKFCSTNLSGWIFDSIVNRNLIDRTPARKIFSAISTIGPAAVFVTLGLMIQRDSHIELQTALTLICLSQFPKGFCAAGFGSNHSDLGVKSVGTIFGLASAFASLSGSGAVYLTGVALDRYGSWSVVFEGLAFTYLIGAIVYFKFGSAKQQFN